jgi:hypothetical protein
MPVHQCDWENLVETIKEAEKKGEAIVQVVDGPKLFVVTSKARREQFETRKRA